MNWRQLFAGRPGWTEPEQPPAPVDSALDRSLDRLARDLATTPTPGELSGGADLAVGVAAIHLVDPGFRPAHFVTGLVGAFLKLQKSWISGEASSSVHDAMAPAFVAQWDEMVDQWRTGGAPVIFDSTEPPRIMIHTVVADSNYAEITARISAPAPPRSEFAQFRNIWGLIRYNADVTKRRTTCFNCGAPFTADSVGECRYCHATLEARTFDWRINRIDDVTHIPWEWSDPHAGDYW